MVDMEENKFNVLKTTEQLQKIYPDVFTSPQTANWIEAIFEVLNDGTEDFIQYFFNGKNSVGLEEYLHLALLGLSHNQIVRREKSSFNAFYDQTIDALMQETLSIHPDKAFAEKVLLTLNVEEANRGGLPFDFELWRHSTMINIQPIRTNYYLSTDYSIGNRILIHEDDLSILNKATFKEKQKLFLDHGLKHMKSSLFPHTVRIFHDYQDWNEVSVVDNRVRIVRNFKAVLKPVYEEMNRRKRGRYKF